MCRTLRIKICNILRQSLCLQGQPPDAPPQMDNPVTVVPVIFALSPALINNDVIDNSTAKGVKLYKSNISKLPVKITASPEDLVLTLQEIHSRVESANWLAIMTIPVKNDANGAAVTRNLITEHGTITMEQLRAHNLTHAETETRDAQNAVQMYLCLAESFTKEAKIKLQLDLDLA